MDTQSVTQTINILVGGDLASTGISLLPLIGAAIALIVSGIVAFRFMRRSHKTHNLSFRSFGILALLAVFGASLALSSPSASAAPTLTLGTDQNEITVTVPEGGGTATTTTTLTSGSTNADGYTLTASLAEAEPGIAIKLKGGDVTTSTALNAGDPALTLKTTDSASSGDTTEVTLDFQIDSTVTPGKKELKLAYVATDNGSTTATMQSFTPQQCAALTVYDGSNESAVITLSDPRGTGQTYQVAKLADGNCWMLDNLKLGSTTGTLNLTPADTDIDSNFTLPQVVTSGTADYDNPGAYGPVSGDTGSGATNYGYLYNWSAATGGESRTSHTEEDGNAPYSICPANWRLPKGGYDTNTYIPLPTNEFNELNARMAGFPNGQDSTYLDDIYQYYQNWQPNGTFKGTFSGGWWEGFSDQGNYGDLWSSSAHPDYVDYAFYAYFFADGVGPDDYDGRAYGVGIRCLLQPLIP